MSKAFLLDLGRCIGCEGCVVACKTGNELPEGTSYIHINEQIRGTFPDLQGGFDNHRCLHCGDAACVHVCPTGALYKEDGLTRLNPDACSGCGYCAQSCPYQVPVMVDGKSTKCDGCRDVVEAGGTPWCVQTCPSDALQFGEQSAMASEAHLRATAMRAKHPNAQVYGESQAGGLGVLMVLPEDPVVLGLPLAPKVPAMANAWQDIVKPASAGVTAFSIVAAGVAGVIARRNHMNELHQLEASSDPSTGGSSNTEVKE